MIGPRSTSARRRRLRRAAVVFAVAVAAIASSAVWAAESAAAAASHYPTGFFDQIRQVPDGVSLVGMATDADTTGAIWVTITEDGHSSARLLANGPGHGGHAFSLVLRNQTTGTHTFCAYGTNVGPGAAAELSCQTVRLDYNPQGLFDHIEQLPDSLYLVGAVTDPDSTAPVRIDITEDNRSLAAMTANGPGHGGHAFALRVTDLADVTDGRHTFCAYAANIGYGVSGNAVCQTVTLDFDPRGLFDHIEQIPDGVFVVGAASDPDTSAPIKVAITEDGVAMTAATVANGPGHGGHAFSARLTTGQTDGRHTFCAYGTNVGAGANANAVCQTVTLDFDPRGLFDHVEQVPNGVYVVGAASDPDTTAPISVQITEDNQALTTLTASGPGHGGHAFAATYPAPPNGTHTFCANATNVGPGQPRVVACQAVALNYNPTGRVASIARSGASIVVTGYAVDPDTTRPINVTVLEDGRTVSTTAAAIARSDVAARFPSLGADHGFSIAVPANANEHTICVIADNTGAGNANVYLNCPIVDAVHPVPPAPPTAVAAIAGFGGATISWKAPTSDGGAPWSSYTVTASPSGLSVTVGAKTTSATIVGLKASTRYTFGVSARNIAGVSAPGTSPVVVTQSAPPAQTSPAPISTSRYVRNITGATGDIATMKAEGAADARANPTGHGYLVLLDIGGQDQADGGVVLSAGVRFVSYAGLVQAVNAYVDGYHSAQRPSAPVMIAIGTNNDMDVSAATGAVWARTVVAPVASHAHGYLGMTVAGANDMEPGFTATYAQTASWLSGYLGATSAPFVFNGSADGCNWTVINGACNNGWSEGGLYNLSAGAAPTRIINLPQIYNDTMAAQWKYISLTGVSARRPKVDFGGALTEWTACAQAGGCGSLTGSAAWSQLWSQLRSTAALMPPSLPYSTDLRIDS